MRLKQLSALLLAMSILAVPSARPVLSVKPVGEEKSESVKTTKKERKAAEQKERKRQRIDKAGYEKEIKKSKAKPTKKTPVAAKKKAKKIKKHAFKPRVKKKVVKTQVHKLAKFNINGDIKSFRTAAQSIILYMNDVKAGKIKPTPKERIDLYREIARFNWITGKKNFATAAHYEVTLNLLREASKYKGLFGNVKTIFINRWLKNQETAKNERDKVTKPAIKPGMKVKAGKPVAKAKKAR